MKAYVIKHLPTGTYMPSRMYRARRGGWSHWIPGPAPDGWAGCDGFDKNPRIFFTSRSAQNALTAWLRGVHSRSAGTGYDWEGIPDDWEEHTVDEPPVPRVRGDMEILPITIEGLG